MSSKYENESFVSTGSDKNCEKEDSNLLQNDEEECVNNRKTKKYSNEKKHKYYDKFFNKKRNKKWNYFIIFFLGICFGFAIWPFFMTIITYKLFYKDNFNNSNFTTSNTSASLKSYGNDKNKKNDNSKISIKDQSQKNTSPHFRPIRFEEIAGIDESKLELLEVVDFIKTTEANVPYIYTSGPEFIEIYVGQGAKRIRQLFAHARSVAPSIVFIDEIDAIGGKRSSGSVNGAGQREHDQTLNQLLVEMDGFSNTIHIMVIGATNRIDTLDSALLRPGRFDRIVYVPLPDVNGRKRILEIYVKKIKSNLKAEDIEKIARLTPGFSGADLENVVNEATILATRNKKSLVTINELFEARDKVSMGPERKSLRQSEHQRRITAYHEAGHAIVAYFLQPKTDPIHKATIISRGNALGYVEQIPVDDRHNYFKSQMEAKLAVCMGGRTAEEIVFGKSETSSGASSDISRATEIAYKMVTEWGMSEKLGPLNYKKRMGDGYSSNRLSAQTVSIIEVEVKTLVEKGKSLSEEILRRHRKELDNLAFALLDKETLSGEEIKNIIDPTNSRDYSDKIHLLNKDTKNDTQNNGYIDNDKKDLSHHNENNGWSRIESPEQFRKMDNTGVYEEEKKKKRSWEEKNEAAIERKNDQLNTVNESANINVDDQYKNKENSERRNDERKVTTDDVDSNKIEIIKTNAKNSIKRIIKKYSKGSNSKNKKIIKIINEHKYYEADKRMNNEKPENSSNILAPRKVDKDGYTNKPSNGNSHNNNIVKNINEFFKNNFPEEKNNNENFDFVKTKKISYNNFNEVVDTSNIKNVGEMKKFNIFEHNLSKLFLFDIFNSY
ncbi:ATP-dependent zinc metalloprotease FTSH 1, putative [Plasmodium malariae]|uniref:ATP-dependent zinc metalloprotease FTSH 1, putative n=1 Tax=Plasmodium malariae TaxID=5858 RepID=A0A1C3L3B3_PLAMA|nr:ATP-dependent zinc metalloprotease FTSH 1, putative [Plasmodium malariae]